MNLSTSRESLASALAMVGRAVSARATLPSLSGILLTSEEGRLTLRATDMEMSLTVSLAGLEVSGTGSVLIPGRLLSDVVRSLPPGEVTIAQRPEQGDVEIACGHARFHLRTLAADDFPRVPEADGESATLPAGPLADTIERVARAASRDEVRPILTGVLVQADGSDLTMVATDSYRLSVKQTQLAEPIAEAFEANVPARALRELARVIASEGADSVELAISRNQVVFRVADVTLSSRLIEGQFPPWKQLLPESFDHQVRLPRAEFLEVARRIGQLAQRNAPLRLAFETGELTIRAETPDVGDASEAMPAPYEGEPLEIAFNPQYLIEGIEVVDGDELTVNLSSPLRPGLLRPVEAEDFSYLVMPIRLNA
ncbi:DNA polymerase III subunit beta [Thermoleophilia bacterium SCSIO 60948]|nr:DNA polymerase III subunit beta [Thermoleophilia bacterium SCSIO 60948]